MFGITVEDSLKHFGITVDNVPENFGERVMCANAFLLRDGKAHLIADYQSPELRAAWRSMDKALYDAETNENRKRVERSIAIGKLASTLNSKRIR